MGYLKIFHLLFLFIWIGGLLATTRMVAYLAKEESIVQQRMLRLWRRFYFVVDLPSMLLALTMGILLLILKNVSLKQAWLHLKLTAVFFLALSDITVGFLLTKFERGISRSNALFFRVLHLIIALLAIIVLFSIFILKKRALLP